MAASGINEHHEARRKQSFIDMQAFHKKQMMENYKSDSQLLSGECEQQSMYNSNTQFSQVRKVGSPPGITDQDIQKYQTNARGNNLVAYTAKLPGRLSSINYSQQW